MSLDQRLVLTTAIATILQVVVIATSLIYMARQAAAARRSVEHLEAARRLDAYLNHRRLLTEINHVLIQDEALAKEIGFDKSEIVAFMFLGYAELVYLQHKSRLVQRGMWRSHRQLAVKFVKFPTVAKVWEKYKHEFLPDFVRYIDGETESNDDSDA